MHLRVDPDMALSRLDVYTDSMSFSVVLFLWSGSAGPLSLCGPKHKHAEHELMFFSCRAWLFVGYA